MNAFYGKQGVKAKDKFVHGSRESLITHPDLIRSTLVSVSRDDR